MTNIKLYVEGGGDSKELHSRCREGFRKLLEKSGFAGRMPRIVAGGGRGTTFDLFRTSALNSTPNEYPILLVDSEDPIPDPRTTSWEHLKVRDDWDRPHKMEDDQAQLMVTCMETWIMADLAALRTYFGARLNENPLLSTKDLEIRHRQAVQDSLVAATRNCSKTYTKGERSFEVLAELNPETLRAHLPHFVALITALEKHP